MKISIWIPMFLGAFSFILIFIKFRGDYTPNLYNFIKDAKQDMLRKQAENGNVSPRRESAKENVLRRQYNQVKEAKEDKYPIPVMIVTYMRSGSSFTGDIVQASNDVFYLFEPFRSIEHAVKGKRTFQYLNGTSRTYTNFLEAVADAVIPILNCQFCKLPTFFFQDPFLKFSNKLRDKEPFISKQNITKEQKFDRMKLRIEAMENVCIQSKYVALKTIRIPLHMVGIHFQRLPDLRVIHLVRDPRATTRSQRKFGVFKNKYLAENVTRFCKRVYKDVLYGELMSERYPERFFPLRYEDLAKHPMEKIAEVYKFLNLELTSSVREYIKNNITSANNTCKVVLCTSKSNSTEQAEKWRYNTEMDFVNIVDMSCRPLYTKLGFRPVNSSKKLTDPKFQTHTLQNPYFTERHV